jgi:phage baseplate assembly protein W
MTQVDFPYHFDRMGRTGSPESDDAHIRDLIEQVLFTAPGERVNRPDFGSGLMQLVFQPNSPELAAATEFLVQSSLQQWLGEVILVEAVTVDADDSALRVSVQYIVRRTATRATAEFTGGGVP